MRKKLLWSVGFGVLVMGVAWLALKRLQHQIQNQFTMTTVVQAKKYIKEGKVIEAGLVEEIAMPTLYVPAMVFQKESELVDAQGQPVFRARTALAKGELLSKSRVIDVATARSLAWTLSPGQTALTLKLSPEQCVGSYLQPGDFVNVYGTFDEQPGVPQVQTQLVLSRVQVLAVDNRVWDNADLGSNKMPQEMLGMENHWVTMAVSPEDVGLLALTAEKGRVILSLISPLDTQIHKMRPFKLADMR